MNRIIIFLLSVFLPLFCFAQQQTTREYTYDAAGNRTVCKVIVVALNAPPAPADSTQLASTNLETPNSLTPFNSSNSLIPDSSLTPSNSLTPEYFVEEINQIVIKIYPNPATEKITLEIADWQELQKAMFQLYSISGQLLREQKIYSLHTEIPLIELSKGIYILKVNINNHLEEWKIIKQ